MKSIKSENIDVFFDAVLLLKNKDECYSFFEDVCTVKELQELAQRFSVAVMLDNKINCQEISHLTGVSTATISRVNKCLQYGSDGYTLAIKRLKEANGGE